MSLGVYVLAGIMAIVTFFFGALDINTNASTKEHMFNSIRSANQNALYDIQEEYEEGQTITNPAMLEAWLMEFAQNADMAFEDLVVNFIQLEGDPPVYLVYAEGYKDKYAIVNNDVYISYLNGSTIVEGGSGKDGDGPVAPHHEHEFEYVANGNVLTALCVNPDCPNGYDSGISITMSEPVNLTYDGSAKFCVFSSEELNTWRVATGFDPVCGYYTKSGAKTTAENSGASDEGRPPVNAGTYVAKIHAIESNVTATFEFTIEKVASSVVTAPTAKPGLIYNGSPQELVNAGTASGGTMQYKVGDGSYSASIPTQTNAGTYTVYYKVVGDVNHYNTTEQSVNVTIGKAASSVTAPTAKTGLVYNGYSQELVSAGTASGGVLKYKIGADGTYLASVPIATDAGTYTIYYKVFGDGNHSDTSEQSVNVTIARASSYTAPVARTPLTYNGEAQELVTAGFAVGNTIQYRLANGSGDINDDGSINVIDSNIVRNYVQGTMALTDSQKQAADVNGDGCIDDDDVDLIRDRAAGNITEFPMPAYSASIPTGVDARTYTVYYKANANTNHSGVSEQSLNATIKKAASSVTAAPTAKAGLVYNGNAQELINAGSALGGTMQYRLVNGSGDANGDGNVNILDAQTIYSFSEGKVTLSDAKMQAADVNGDGRIDNADADLVQQFVQKTITEFPTSTYSASIPTGVDARTYTVYCKVIGDANHNDTTEQSLSVTIGKTASSIATAPTAKSLTYNGNAQALVNAGTVSGGTMQYKVGSGGTYSKDVPTAMDAGTYIVYYKVVGDSNHNDTSEQSVTVTIAKATASVTAAPTAKSLTYNGNAQALVNAGTASGGTMQYRLSGGSYSTSIPTAINAGTYTVYYKAFGDANHSDTTEQSINVVIGNAASSVTAAPTAKNLIYTSSAQTLINAGTASNGTMQYRLSGGSYSTSIPTAINAGTYAVYYKVFGSTNYNDTDEQSVSVTISKVSDYTAPTAKTGLKYTGSAQALINAGSALGGTMQYKLAGGSYSTSIPTATAAGTYTVYYKVDASTNHSGVSEKSISVTISAIPASVVTAPTAKSLTYNGTAQALVNAGTANNGTMQYKLSGGSYSTSIPTATNAGTYTVYYKAAGNTNYSDTTEQSISVTIAKVSDYTAPTAKTGLIYNGSAQTLVNAGSALGGTMQYKLSGGSYSTSIPTATAAGTYTVYYKVDESTNHSGVSEKSVSVTIGKASSSVVNLPTAKNLTYNGNAQELINAGTASSGTMQYKLGADGTYSTNIPTAVNAGNYTVYYKVVGNTGYDDTDEQSVGVTIAKVSDYTAPTAKTGLVYNGSEQELINSGFALGGTMQYKLFTGSGDVTGDGVVDAKDTTRLTKYLAGMVSFSDEQMMAADVNGDGSVDDADMKYLTQHFAGIPSAYSTDIPTVINGGTYTVYYKVDESANHSGVSEKSIKVTVGKLESSVVTAPTAKTLTYTGEEQKLINAGTASGGTMQYKLDLPDEVYSKYIPTATDAGTYTVYYKVVGDGGHNNTEEQSVNVTIAKAPSSVTTAPTAKTLDYNGYAQALVNAGTASGGTMQYKLSGGSYSTSVPTATDAGTYTVYYKVVGDSNHNDTSEQSVNVTIAKATPSVATAPTAKTLTYNGNAQALVNAGVTSGGTMQYRLANGSGDANGDGSVNIFDAQTIYSFSRGEVTLSDAKMQAADVNGDGRIDNADADLVFQFVQKTITEFPTSAYSTSVPTGVDARTYTVYYKVFGDSNHNDTTEQSLSVTIGKTASSIATAPTAKSLTYNGNAQALVNAGAASGGTMQYRLANGSGDVNGDGSVSTNDVAIINGFVEGARTLSDAKMQAADVNGDGRIDNTDVNLVQQFVLGTITEFPAASYSTSIPTGVDARTYTVYYKVVGDSNHNDVSEQSVNVTIAKAPSSVTTAPTAKSLTYNGNAQTLINAGTASFGTMQYKLGTDGTYSTSVPTATDAGTYTVYYKVFGDANHSDTAEQPVNVTIEKVSDYTAPTVETLTYTGSAQALVSAGSAFGGTMKYKIGSSGTYSANIPTATNVGTYKIYYKVDESTNHTGVPEQSIDVKILANVNYLCFAATEANSTVQLAVKSTKTATPANLSLQSSTDGVNWSTYNVGDTITLANEGDRVYFKGVNSQGTSQKAGAYHYFVMTGKIAASGNLMSIIDGQENGNTIPTTAASYCFNKLFYSCTSLVSAPKLPATVMRANCYQNMFNGCTNLTEAPDLPAKTLASYCYDGMFEGCTNLTKAPDNLPATTLQTGCYYFMFYNCQSLTNAPTLPATTMQEDCYADMFMSCYSLTTAPALPAKTLADYCYAEMFKECFNLTTAPDLPATSIKSYCYSYMFHGCDKIDRVKIGYTGKFAGTTTIENPFEYWLEAVSHTGDLYYNGTDTTRSTSAIPYEWVVHKY